ncbi:MAG: trigger factor, partial [Muricoprocola sp.]
ATETESETETEAATEATTEAESETETEAVTEAATEAESETEEETEAVAEMMPEYNAEDYVTLGDYTNLTVEVEPIEITDDEIQDKIDLATIEELTDCTVEAGDIANIDYEGKLDGEAFDGGSATGYDLGIGSGTFIPGFEDALIGMAVGETKDIELTFPEEYYSEDLAGKDVVFTVTVNSVKRVPTLTDEVAQKVAGQTAEEYKESIRQELVEKALEQRKSNVQNELVAKATENATIKDYPEANLEYTINHGMAYYEYIAAMYGMTLDDFLAANGMDQESFRAEMEPVAKQALAQEMVLLAIAKEEGLELTDEEYETGLSELTAQQGLTDSQTLLDAYGETYIRCSLTQQKVVQYLYENAQIVEVAAEEETETEAAEETELATEAATEAAETETSAEETEAAETEAAETEVTEEAATEEATE